MDFSENREDQIDLQEQENVWNSDKLQSNPLSSSSEASKLESFSASQIVFSSPSSISEQMEISESPFFFGSDPSANWDTATMTTVTMPRSQRSTLQRESMPPPQPEVKNSRTRLQESNRKFRSHEKYFEHKAYVFGHKYSSKSPRSRAPDSYLVSIVSLAGTREMMWTGKHSFPFTYCLPSKLPASFHGRFGYVRYFCEASLERHNLPTVQRRAFFSVNNIMDLNTDSKADVSNLQRSTTVGIASHVYLVSERCK